MNYVAIRDDCVAPNPLCTLTGRQDNRGFEGLARFRPTAASSTPCCRIRWSTTSPLRTTAGTAALFGSWCFDNDPDSATYLTSTAQHAYQLELQSDVADRINDLKPGNATSTDPRQGRNIGLSAIVAINGHEFLVLERDNRGIGVDDPAGNNAVGSKRIFKIDIDGATNIVGLPSATPGSSRSPSP